MSSWSTRADVYLLRIKSDEPGESEINKMVFVYCRVPAMEDTSAGESTVKITLYPNEVKRWVLYKYLGYDPNVKSEGYMEETNLLIANKGWAVETMMRCSMQ